MHCLIVREPRRRPRQKLNSDTYARFLVKEIEQLLRNIRVYTECWAGEDSHIVMSSKLDKVVMFPFTKQKHLDLSVKWIWENVTNEVRNVPICYAGIIMDTKRIRG